MNPNYAKKKKKKTTDVDFKVLHSTKCLCSITDFVKSKLYKQIYTMQCCFYLFYIWDGLFIREREKEFC